MLDEATHYHLLKLLQDNLELTQRELAEAAGVSLGKVNYCLKALIAKGLIKAANFRNNPNKKAYAYLRSPPRVSRKRRALRCDFFSASGKSTSPSSKRSLFCREKCRGRAHPPLSKRRRGGDES